jgi:hypothetical protein
MQTKSFRRSLKLIFILISLTLWGCTPFDSIVSKSSGDLDFKRVAVVPFQKVDREDINIKYTRHPLPAGSFRIDQPDGAPEKEVEKLFLEQLQQYPQIQIYPTEKVGGSFVSNAGESFKTTVPDVLLKVGKELQADAIVVGYLYRWRQLKGAAYGAEKPASVAFDVQLFRASDGSLLWRGLFDHTQTSLMENMSQISFFFKEGSKWLTAEELAKLGMGEVMKSFPAQRPEGDSK